MEWQQKAYMERRLLRKHLRKGGDEPLRYAGGDRVRAGAVGATLLRALLNSTEGSVATAEPAR